MTSKVNNTDLTTVLTALKYRAVLPVVNVESFLSELIVLLTTKYTHTTHTKHNSFNLFQHKKKTTQSLKTLALFFWYFAFCNIIQAKRIRDTAQQNDSYPLTN